MDLKLQESFLIRLGMKYGMRCYFYKLEQDDMNKAAWLCAFLADIIFLETL